MGHGFNVDHVHWNFGSYSKTGENKKTTTKPPTECFSVELWTRHETLHTHTRN